MIEPQDIERLKEIFVTKDDCHGNIDSVEKKLSIDNAKLAVIESQLKLILWVLMAVGGCVITILVDTVFGG